MRDLALHRSTYAGADVPGEIAGFSSINPLYTALPWVFRELFADLPQARFLVLAEAGAFLGIASVLLDHLNDDQLERPGAAFLLQQAFSSAGLAGLRQEIPASSPFWSHFDRLTELQLHGLALELELQGQPARFDDRSFRLIAEAKAAPVLIGLAALLYATTRGLKDSEGLPGMLDAVELSLDAVERSLDALFQAGQMLDDVLDWREDLRSGHLTGFLARTSDKDLWEQAVDVRIERLEAVVRSGWLDIEDLQRAIERFGEAEESAAPLSCAAWMEFVRFYRSEAEEVKRRLVAERAGEKIKALVASARV